MLSVMLHPNRPGRFIRQVRDKDGRSKDPEEILVFDPKEPVNLTNEQCKAVADDIGVALVAVDVEEDTSGGKARVKVNWDATAAAVKGIAEAKKKASKAPELLQHQRAALGDEIPQAKERGMDVKVDSESEGKGS